MSVVYGASEIALSIDSSLLATMDWRGHEMGYKKEITVHLCNQQSIRNLLKDSACRRIVGAVKTFSHILLNTVSAGSKLKEAVPIFLDDTCDHLSHIFAHCLTITIAVQPPGGD